MSYSIDANILVYACDETSPHYKKAQEFIVNLENNPDLLCLTWPTLMAFQRIVTHPSIFQTPLDPAVAWENISALLTLPRVCIIQEEESFASDYSEVAATFPIRGNLVPDAHFATILREHGVKTLFTADSDFRKFDFLETLNPLV